MSAKLGARALGLAIGILGLVTIAASCDSSSPGLKSTDFPTDDSGFITFTPSADSRTIYVSSSQGNDSNDGLSEMTPVKSVNKGISLLRDGFPDYLLFKKGDTWSSGLGTWSKNGRSATEPMVVSTYGTGDRPLFVTAAAEHAIQAIGTAASFDYIAFVGLSFYTNTYDPESPDWVGTSAAANGLMWLRGTKGLVVEDCSFRSYAVGAVFQTDPGVSQSNILFHRNLLLDSWADTHGQSLYVSGTNGIAIEENVIDNKGWDPNVASSSPTVFSHAIYIQTDARNVAVRGNIVLNGTSHGIQLRPGGIAEDNLFAHNAIGMLAGGGDTPVPGGVNATLTNNVILDGDDISADQPRAWGIGLSNIASATVSGNIIAHAIGSMPTDALDMNANTTYSGNIIYDWGDSPATPGPFLDPTRSLESYNASLGGPGTYADFIAEVRQQSKDRWRPDYMAVAVNAYIRAGFQPPAPASP